MAATYELKSKSYDGRYLVLKCTQVQDIASNTSTINWTLTSTGGNNDYYSTGATTAKINAKQVYYKARTAWSSYAFPAARGSVSGSTVVQHDAQGNCSIPVSLATAIYTSTVTTQSGTWTLDPIPRAAMILTAPNFNDEENPTITYSNPAGNNVETLQACILSSGYNTTYVAYRNIDKTGSSYTFNLTNAEREALRWGTINSNTLTVIFYIKTVIGGVEYGSATNKILTIVNANPTISPTVTDVGGTSTALTGDANKIIKGFNYVNVASNAKALKGASIKSQQITSGAAVINGASGSFNNTESADFTFTVTDSRGNTTTQTVTKEFINYIKLTCNLIATNPTTDGEVTLKINGHYFNGSFGAVDNVLTVQYRYKENDGAYGEWIDATKTISGNTYNTTLNLTGLDYRKAYTFQARVFDKAELIESSEKRVKSIPVFDWGENDFQFNVDVYDKNGGKLGSEIIANDYDAVSLTGKSLLESGWITITPVANQPTTAAIAYKKYYKKMPVVLVTASSGVIGSQVLGVSTNGISRDGANIVITRTNSTPTTVYYYIYGEADE